MARQCKRLFKAKPMPELPSPEWEVRLPALGQTAFAGGDGQKMQGPFVVIPKQ
jgi:hypothetical protein